MTTAWKQNQSPRLPSNHVEHVDKILAREAAWRRREKRGRMAPYLVIAILLIISAFLFL